VKARLLIEQDDDLKGELFSVASIAYVLERHGLKPKENGTYKTRAIGYASQEVDVNWSSYDGLTIPMTPAPDVSVVAQVWATPAWAKHHVRILLTYGKTERKIDADYQASDESEYQALRKLDTTLTKLKRRLSLYKPRTERGLDKIITTLGYR